MKIGALDYDETTKKVTANGLLFGHVSHHTGNPINRNGYYFIPAVAGRKGSRRPYPTIKKCIPAWVTRQAIAATKESNWKLSDPTKDKASEEIAAEPAEETMSEQEDRKFIESLTQRLSADPRLAQPVLKAVSECNEEFIRRTQSYRSSEASQVILDLINAIMNPKQFAKLTPDMQKNAMHRVIAYHFPNVKDEPRGYAPCELEFFKKFAEKKK